MVRSEQSYHEDLGPLGPDGKRLFAYRYHLIRFTDDEGTSVIARSYIDAPSEAHFLRLEPSTPNRFIVTSDFQRPLFVAAVKHLRSDGKSLLTWLNYEAQAYVPIPDEI